MTGGPADTPSGSGSSPTSWPPSCTCPRRRATGCAGRRCCTTSARSACPRPCSTSRAALVAGEWDMVRLHPDQGAELAGPLLEWLGEWGTAISQHHERFDGMGYPRGLAGHEISRAGRIVAVADVFEVMTAARSYKRPMSVAAARRELADSAGTQLDPACVRAFLGASLPRVLWAVGPLALLANLPFLRQVAEAGRVVEQAGNVAAGQAATVAVAATTAVVLAIPATGPAVVEHHSAEPRSQGNSSVLGAERAASPADSGQTVRQVAVPAPRPSKAADPRRPPRRPRQVGCRRCARVPARRRHRVRRPHPPHPGPEPLRQRRRAAQLRTRARRTRRQQRPGLLSRGLGLGRTRRRCSPSRGPSLWAARRASRSSPGRRSPTPVPPC